MQEKLEKVGFLFFLVFSLQNKQAAMALARRVRRSLPKGAKPRIWKEYQTKSTIHFVKSYSYKKETVLLVNMVVFSHTSKGNFR